MKTLEKFYNERDHWTAMVLAIVCAGITLLAFIFCILPNWDSIMQSNVLTSWDNPWMPILALEIFFGIFALGFLLDVWFYKTNRTKKPLAFMTYIGGGILFGIVPMVLLWAILSSIHEGSSTNVWLFEPLLGAWLGMLFGCLVNFKKLDN